MNTAVDSVILALLAVIIIPILTLSFRAAIRWKGIEDDLKSVSKSLHDIVEDKEKVHTEIITQMREDRSATDKRLRWLEETIWRIHGPKQ